MRVFVSYSRKNVDVANYIAAELRKRGADVFVDYERLKAGENFPERLALEIENSDTMIFLLSEYSAASDWVRDEVQYAHRHHKRTIPVALDTTEIPRSLFFLTSVQKLDFTGWNRDEQLDMAIRGLAASLDLPERPTPLSSAPPRVGTVTSLPGRIERNTPLPHKPAVDVANILPPPFEWIEIPGGTVMLTDRGGYISEPITFAVEPFAIAKYPITNGQYQVFADAPDGYQNTKWWNYSDDAIVWQKARPMDTAFSGNDHPRTNVSWFDAVSFCLWLSSKTSDTIMLPTEQQWQRAAQGDTDWAYSWGNEFDPSRGNNSVEGRSTGTAYVTKYEKKGTSPFGVVDMNGNVWEWCLTDYETGSQDIKRAANYRVMRGGSWWFNLTQVLRADYRLWDHPYNGDDDRGFRVARLIESVG